MAVHEDVGVAAGEVEEDEVGGGVVEEGGQHAGHPEIHGVDGVARAVVDEGDEAGHRAVFAGFEDGEDGGDGDEDAEEEFADFGDGIPVELVAGADLFVGNFQGNQGDGEQEAVAHEVLQFVVAAEDVEGDAGFPDAGEQHGTDDGGQEEEVAFAVDFQRAVGAGVARQDFVFEGVVVAVDEVEQGEQHGRADEDGRQHVLHRPAEVHAFQEAEEEGGVAQRGEAAADVGDEEDEKDDAVDAVFAVVVGFKQRADHEHGRAGGAHYRGQERADGEDGSVGFRRAVQVAPHEDAAGDGV